jgi:hypothetical protein
MANKVLCARRQLSSIRIHYHVTMLSAIDQHLFMAVHSLADAHSMLIVPTATVTPFAAADINCQAIYHFHLILM